jgi:hypothetical protein
MLCSVVRSLHRVDLRESRLDTKRGRREVCVWRKERKDFGSLDVSIALMENMEKLRSRSVRKGIFAATRST